MGNTDFAYYRLEMQIIARNINVFSIMGMEFRATMHSVLILMAYLLHDGSTMPHRHGCVQEKTSTGTLVLEMLGMTVQLQVFKKKLNTQIAGWLWWTVK